jgi:N-methylhydantoinase A
VDEVYVARMREAFLARYRQEYGYVDRDTPIEVTDWYVVATLSGAPCLQSAPARHLYQPPHSSREEVGGRARSRPAWFPESRAMIEAAVLDRYAMRRGDIVHGPALIEERESTTVVQPGDTLTVSERGNLIIDIEPAR